MAKQPNYGCIKTQNRKFTAQLILITALGILSLDLGLACADIHIWREHLSLPDPSLHQLLWYDLCLQ